MDINLDNNFTKENSFDYDKDYFIGVNITDDKYNDKYGYYEVSELEFDEDFNYSKGGIRLTPIEDVFELDCNAYQSVYLCEDSNIFGFVNDNNIWTYITDKVIYGPIYKLNLDTIKYFERYLINKYHLSIILFKCIEMGDIKSVNYILNKNPKIPDEFKPIYLHIAIKNDNKKMIQCLVENHDIDVTSEDNVALKFSYFKKKNYKLCLYLIQQGANINVLHLSGRLRLKFLRRIYGKVWE